MPYNKRLIGKGKRKALSGMLTLLLIGMVMLVSRTQLARTSGTIYIRADGAVDPPTAPIFTPDNASYIFMSDINEPIVVERDNILIDGAGYSLLGQGLGAGINLTRRANVTVRNLKIKNFEYGLFLEYSSNISIIRNYIINNDYGIYLGFSSSNNSIIRNVFVNNGLYVYCSYRNVVKDNLVNGRPLVYLVGISDFAVGDAGQVILIRCKRIKVENLNLSHATVGVELWETHNSTIAGNNVANNVLGIYLYDSANNTISGNYVTNCSYGIYIIPRMFSGNAVTGNYVMNCSYGVILFSSYSNIVYGNSLNNNSVGVLLLAIYGSPSNIIYHNNFLNNAVQARSDDASAIWDNGYPSGGNYWSDYHSFDLRSGPHQNETGSDGIGDMPYIIDSNNRDRYPLMNPWIIHNIAITSLTVSKSSPKVNETVGIYVTVQNRGYVNETFAIFINYTGVEGGLIANQTLTLAPIESRTLSFIWTPTKCGVYEIKAYTSPIPNDINPEDNTKTTRIAVVIQGLGGEAFKKYFSTS